VAAVGVARFAFVFAIFADRRMARIEKLVERIADAVAPEHEQADEDATALEAPDG
jgi:hypothetical protein